VQSPKPDNEHEEHCQNKESGLAFRGVEPFDQAGAPAQPAARRAADKAEEMRAQIGLGPLAAEKGQKPCASAQREQQCLEGTTRASC